MRVALHNRADLFSNAPVVFASVDRAAVADLRLDADVTGTWVHQGWTETLDLAARLQPDTQRAVVVTGSSAVDRVWLEAARRQLAAHTGPITVSYLANLRLADVLKEVAALPKQTVVIVGAFQRDAAGHDFITAEAIKRIAASSSVPVYGLTPAAVSTGAVGGHVVSFEAHGRVSARLSACPAEEIDKQIETGLPRIVEGLGWTWPRSGRCRMGRTRFGSRIRAHRTGGRSRRVL